jgi:hypothetical protein
MASHKPHSQFNECPDAQIDSSQSESLNTNEANKTPRKDPTYPNYVRQFRELGYIGFAATHFGNFVGQAATHIFLKAAGGLDRKSKLAVLIDVEDTLPTILGPQFDPEVVDLLMHGDGVWGEQEELAQQKGKDSKIISRLLERVVFCVCTAMFGALIDRVTGTFGKKLTMFQPIVEYMVKNRRY